MNKIIAAIGMAAILGMNMIPSALADTITEEVVCVDQQTGVQVQCPDYTNQTNQNGYEIQIETETTPTPTPYYPRFYRHRR